jgi:hypothetical protein
MEPNSMVAKLEAQLARTKKNVENAQAKLDRIRAERQQLHNSLSWKLTRPLRYLQKIQNLLKTLFSVTILFISELLDCS